jgi:hypothetical protein
VLRARGEGGLLRALDGRGLRLPMSTMEVMLRASGQATDVAEPAGAAAATAWAEPDSAELRAELADCLAPLSARLPELYRPKRGSCATCGRR